MENYSEILRPPVNGVRDGGLNRDKVGAGALLSTIYGLIYLIILSIEPTSALQWTETRKICAGIDTNQNSRILVI